MIEIDFTIIAYILIHETNLSILEYKSGVFEGEHAGSSLWLLRFTITRLNKLILKKCSTCVLQNKIFGFVGFHLKSGCLL